MGQIFGAVHPCEQKGRGWGAAVQGNQIQPSSWTCPNYGLGLGHVCVIFTPLSPGPLDAH